MIIFPALDLRGGRVVRLTLGDPNQQTTYSDDPVATAQRWKDAGAAWLHVINLDGALGDLPDLPGVLGGIAALGLPVQFGGGLRTLDDAARAFDAGVSRVILGTPVVKEPEIAGKAVDRFGAEAVAVALDARDGFVAAHGWQSASPWTPADLGKTVAAMGVRWALFTDLGRDGLLTGANVDATAALARETGLNVIASGGVASIDDVHALATAQPLLAGVVIGKALYNGALSLEAALAAAQDSALGTRNSEHSSGATYAG
jgi:phosphoribosylformimino-5-aminoimidazole carboxamide ribotide isomerase